MKHIIISDTHSPECIDIPYVYIKRKELYKEVDVIVINGDLLGVFSLEKSNIYNKNGINYDEKMRHLKECAPKFYHRFKNLRSITEEMVLKYVEERYEWCYNVIKKFSELKLTVFNMGNHESNNHFLILNEIPFLTEHTITRPSDKELQKIFQTFEDKLISLEKEGNFKYLRNEPVVINNTLILGISGESHSTEGFDIHSMKQEQKTKHVIEKAKIYTDKFSQIIIYNHTQGKYERETGNFWCASTSLSDFMKNLPLGVFNPIFVQSHNHWSYSQFILSNGYHILMNNAGLHNGIFNIIDFNILKVTCYDVDPKNDKITEIGLNSTFKEYAHEKELIERYYQDGNYILKRKNNEL